MLLKSGNYMLYVSVEIKVKQLYSAALLIFCGNKNQFCTVRVFICIKMDGGRNYTGD